MTGLFKWACAALVLGIIAFLLQPYHMDVYRKLLFWVAMALSFNFLFGVTGQIALSHFAFAGIGAYTLVIFFTKIGVPLPLAVLASVALSAVTAFIVSFAATRLEGFYLALATLAFAQLLTVLLDEGGDLTGGTGGLTNYSLPPILGVTIDGPWYVLVMITVLLGTLAILVRIDHSWFGRACRAIRDNPEAAAAMGVNVAKTKIVVFTVTSIMAAVCGMVYAFYDNTINPPVFGLEKSFLLIFIVIVGGSGRHAGAMIGTVILILSQFVLEPLIGPFHALATGAIVVAAILFQPKGLIGLWDRYRARWDDQAREDAV